MLIMMINLLGKGLYLKTNFFDLVNLVLRTIWYSFNSQFYQQTDGVAMKGPTSSTTADIYVQIHKRSAISTMLHPLKAWEQIVNGVYSILKRMHLENFFHHINNLHLNIKFTTEEESKWRTRVSLHFIETEQWKDLCIRIYDAYAYWPIPTLQLLPPNRLQGISCFLLV